MTFPRTDPHRLPININHSSKLEDFSNKPFLQLSVKSGSINRHHGSASDNRPDTTFCGGLKV